MRRPVGCNESNVTGLKCGQYQCVGELKFNNVRTYFLFENILLKFIRKILSTGLIKVKYLGISFDKQSDLDQILLKLSESYLTLI